MNYRGEEVAQQARMLTILALYQRYAGGDDAFLLSHFPRAKALAEWLAFRRSLALNFTTDDPRYGIPPGEAEPMDFARNADHSRPPLHYYASAAEMYRAFTELGEVWSLAPLYLVTELPAPQRGWGRLN